MRSSETSPIISSCSFLRPSNPRHCSVSDCSPSASKTRSRFRSEEHTSELQSHSDLHSFPTRRSSDLNLADHLVVLLSEALEPEALLGLGLLTERFEDPLEVRDVAFGLLQVPLEALAELGALHLVDQLRQDLFGQLLLHIEDVAELVQEETSRRGDICHLYPPRSWCRLRLPGEASL